MHTELSISRGAQDKIKDKEDKIKICTSDLKALGGDDGVKGKLSH